MKAIEAQETKEDTDEGKDDVLNMLFKTEHSKIYLEDFGQVRNQQLSSSEESGYDDELMDSEEFALYNEIHEDEDAITSGYSTISSSKEEAYLSRHIAN